MLYAAIGWVVVAYIELPIMRYLGLVFVSIGSFSAPFSFWTFPASAGILSLLARLHHVRLSPHVWGAGVGLAAACHFVASIPDYPHSRNILQPPLTEYDVGDNALRDTIFKEPIAVENGACVLPDGPGLGVELDPLAVRRFNEA